MTNIPRLAATLPEVPVYSPDPSFIGQLVDGTHLIKIGSAAPSGTPDAKLYIKNASTAQIWVDVAGTWTQILSLAGGTLSGALTLGVDSTLADGVDLAVGSTTGSKIGTAVTQKLGFWNVTPVVQPSGAEQAALTDSSGGTANGTVEAVGATNSGDVSGAINNNFKEVVTLLHAIRTALVAVGIMKGAA